MHFEVQFYDCTKILLRPPVLKECRCIFAQNNFTVHTFWMLIRVARNASSSFLLIVASFICNNEYTKRWLSFILSLKIKFFTSQMDKNHKGVCGLTPLHVAAYADNDEAFKILLDAGAKPCFACSQGYRPLHTAAVSGSRKYNDFNLKSVEIISNSAGIIDINISLFLFSQEKT